MKQFAYFDHAATTPMHPLVLEKYYDVLKTEFGNSGSIHHFGRTAYGLLEEARNTLAQMIHAKANEIVFTSGGTESDNTAIIQSAKSRQKLGKHIITTNIEHPAVMEPMKYLEEEGFEVTYLQADETGMVYLDQLIEALREDTILVSMMYGNNEIGTLLPIKEIGTYLKKEHPEIIFHTDAVQAFGLEDINVDEEGIDLLSASAHKLNGPKGVGLLYIRTGVNLPSLMKGGEQELKRRAGTVNVPGIVAFQTAAEVMLEERTAKNLANEQLRERTIEGLKNAGVKIKVNGHPTARLSHILSLQLLNVPSGRLLTLADLAGVAIATGSACTAGNPEPSHVLEAIYGKDHAAVTNTIRISFGLNNQEAEIDQLVALLAKVANNYQAD